jgi:nitroreductase
MARGSTRRAVLRRAAAAGLTLAAPTAGGIGMRLATAGEAAPSGGALDGLLDRRRMVRRFTAEPVDETVVRRLIDAATRAPSAGNQQPWGFVVVRDAARRTALGRAALGQMFVAEAPVVIVPCADPARARGRYGERAERYAVIDTSFASLLLLLAVVEEGLGACFVGAFEDAEVKRILSLPADVQPLAVVPVGHPAEQPGPQKRRPAASVVHDERW